MFEQWLLDNQLSESFRLAELNRKFSITHEYVGFHGDLKIVKLIKNIANPLADSVDGKFYVLPNFIETEFIESEDNVPSSETIDEPQEPAKPSRKSGKVKE